MLKRLLLTAALAASTLFVTGTVATTAASATSTVSYTAGADHVTTPVIHKKKCKWMWWHGKKCWWCWHSGHWVRQWCKKTSTGTTMGFRR